MHENLNDEVIERIDAKKDTKITIEIPTLITKHIPFIFDDDGKDILIPEALWPKIVDIVNEYNNRLEISILLIFVEDWFILSG